MMYRKTKKLVWASIMFVGLTFCVSARALADHHEPFSAKTLVEALRAGGYNIYFRHAATDWSSEDQVTAEGDWQSCDPKKMRQLFFFMALPSGFFLPIYFETQFQ